MDCLRKNYLIQFVDQPTRYRPNDRPSTLDLIIGSDDFIDNIQYLSHVGKSDHSVLYFSCNIKPALSYVSNANKLNYSRGDYDQLRKYVHSRLNDSSVVLNDVDAYWYHIKSVISKGVSMFVPKRDKYAWKKKKTCHHSVTKKALGLIHRKHRLWNRLLETKDPSVARDYKRVRNLVRSHDSVIERNSKKLLDRAGST